MKKVLVLTWRTHYGWTPYAEGRLIGETDSAFKISFFFRKVWFAKQSYKYQEIK